MDHLIKERMDGLADERAAAGQHLIRDAGQGPLVGPVVGFLDLTCCLFW